MEWYLAAISWANSSSITYSFSSRYATLWPIKYCCGTKPFILTVLPDPECMVHGWRRRGTAEVWAATVCTCHLVYVERHSCVHALSLSYCLVQLSDERFGRKLSQILGQYTAGCVHYDKLAVVGHSASEVEQDVLHAVILGPTLEPPPR